MTNLRPRHFLPLLWLLLIAIAIWLLLLRWPQRLDIDLPPQSLTGTAVDAGRAGPYAVYLNLIPHGDDNGPATIRVSVNGRYLAGIDTFYNYDLFLDQPAGYTYRWWVDGDWRPDVIITTSHDPARRYVIGSNAGGDLRLTILD